jgi:hypothetical protein
LFDKTALRLGEAHPNLLERFDQKACLFRQRPDRQDLTDGATRKHSTVGPGLIRLEQRKLPAVEKGLGYRKEEAFEMVDVEFTGFSKT